MLYTFKVEDMSCGGCAASIRKAVQRIPGVENVSANPTSKDVVVEAPAEVSRESVVAAINGAGYTKVTTVEA